MTLRTMVVCDRCENTHVLVDGEVVVSVYIQAGANILVKKDVCADCMIDVEQCVLGTSPASAVPVG
jgi:hypothetical protein